MDTIFGEIAGTGNNAHRYDDMTMIAIGKINNEKINNE
jgi:hypothetical protein